MNVIFDFQSWAKHIFITMNSVQLLLIASSLWQSLSEF